MNTKIRRNPIPSDPSAIAFDRSPIGNLVKRIEYARGVLIDDIEGYIYSFPRDFLEIKAEELWTWSQQEKEFVPIFGDWMLPGELGIFGSSRSVLRVFHYLGNGVLDIYELGR